MVQEKDGGAWTRLVVVQEMGGHLSGRRMLEAISIEIVIALICLLSNLQLIWLDLPPACKVLIPGISGNICSVKKCECIQSSWMEQVSRPSGNRSFHCT